MTAPMKSLSFRSTVHLRDTDAMRSARSRKNEVRATLRQLSLLGQGRGGLFPVLLVVAFWFCAWPQWACAQWVQQTISLRPGWNAVFLEVQPVPEECDLQFANLPVESVWDFNRPVDAPQFVQDPSTLIPGAPGWLTWFPPSHPLASQGSLFILRADRPYLIKVRDNAPNLNWIVTGKPSLRPIRWQAGALNFVGFHVGAPGPTFETLFSGESGLAGQPVYLLDPTGVWRSVAALSTARPGSGESYWIRCRQPAQRTSTIEIDSAARLGLSFVGNEAEQSLRVRNTSGGPRTISVRLLASTAPPAGQAPLAGPVPLESWRADFATASFGWEPLSAALRFTALPAGQEWNIRLGVRRAGAAAAAPGSLYQSLLEVTDDAGTRWIVPVSADPPGTTASVAALGLGAAQVPAARAGLWIGDVVLKAVSQPAHPSDPSRTRRAGGELSFRLMVHLDGAGTARLLRQVYLVRKPAITGPDPDNPGFSRVEEAARTVVVTDEALIPGIIGTGGIAGRRISSTAFGFRQPLALTGGAFGSGTLTAAIPLDYDDPLNPFRHRFHPDHNNLDERFEQKLPEGKESFTVTRSIALEFTAADPLGLNPPGWGEFELGGNYRETISGLHRTPIQVAGTFRLVRAAAAARLNDGQNAGVARARSL